VTTGQFAGKGYRVPFIVRAPAARRVAVLVQASVNTWEAYNPWGGKSLYPFNSTGRVPAVKLSFERPFDHAFGNTTPLAYEVLLVRFLEREGYDVAYQTDADTHASPASLTRPPVVIANGHGEYWTREIRQAWDGARDAGGNLIFAGADFGFWQVRYEDEGASSSPHSIRCGRLLSRSVLYPRGPAAVRRASARRQGIGKAGS
jgi:N,N-dimethylformamidase beta subunit-like, C-terminal